jgi:hypothetical protein
LYTEEKLPMIETKAGTEKNSDALSEQFFEIVSALKEESRTLHLL